MTQREQIATRRGASWHTVMLLSVHPQYAERILDGTKTVELRRTKPAVRSGQPVLLYATQPLGAVVATCRIRELNEAPVDVMWARVQSNAAVSRADYERYLAGRDTAVALFIEDVQPLTVPITLGDLRATGQFHPPQTWHYLDAERLGRLTALHPAGPHLQSLLAGRVPAPPRATAECAEARLAAR